MMKQKIVLSDAMIDSFLQNATEGTFHQLLKYIHDRSSFRGIIGVQEMKRNCKNEEWLSQIEGENTFRLQEKIRVNPHFLAAVDALTRTTRYTRAFVNEGTFEPRVLPFAVCMCVAKFIDVEFRQLFSRLFRRTPISLGRPKMVKDLQRLRSRNRYLLRHHKARQAGVEQYLQAKAKHISNHMLEQEKQKVLEDVFSVYH